MTSMLNKMLSEARVKAVESESGDETRSKQEKDLARLIERRCAELGKAKPFGLNHLKEDELIEWCDRLGLHR